MGTFQGGAKGVPLPELHGGGRRVGRRHGCRGRIARAAPGCQVRWTWAWLSGAFCCVYCAFLYVCCVLQAVTTLEGNSVGIAQVVPTKGCLGDKPVPAVMLTTHFGLAGGARATRWLTCPLPASSFGTRLRITPGPTPPAAAATFARRERRRSLSRAPRASLCATFPPSFFPFLFRNLDLVTMWLCRAMCFSCRYITMAIYQPVILMTHPARSMLGRIAC